MAYDEGLAERIRAVLQGEQGLEERQMFGGIGFLLDGNMACGVIGDDLIVRVGKENYESALAEDHSRPFDFTGRPMTGWVKVLPQGLESRQELKNWVSKGLATSRSLPPK